MGGTAEAKAFVPILGTKAFFIANNNGKEVVLLKKSLAEIKGLAKDYNVIPICKEILGDVATPISLLQTISRISNKYYLLESIEGGERWGRYSFLGYDPTARITCKKGTILIDNGEEKMIRSSQPLQELRAYLKQYRAPKLEGVPPFAGGLVGYFAYNMFAYKEPHLNAKESQFNDFDLMLFDKVIAYDHLKQRIIIIVNMSTEHVADNHQKALAQIEEISRVIRKQTPLGQFKKERAPNFTCNISRTEFYHMIEQVKEKIQEGDLLQAVISRRFTAKYEESLLNAYRILRTTNPSPYMVFLQNEDLQLISTSPETLVKLQDGVLSSFPIAGSRPRGQTKEEDEVLAEELLTDAKELAEHNMLVDLGRNDLGKIAEFGSVKVADHKKIQYYSKVMHLATELEGRITPDRDALDAIQALLPAGTLLGAPKIRAWEIIEELEKEPRGIYGGAIGYLNFTGNMDTCIAIRMAVKKDDTVYVQAGGGIVADSIPEKEYEESFYKAQAIIEAIKSARKVEQ